jgi:uncharacterized protein with FMN-binding domain
MAEIIRKDHEIENKDERKWFSYLKEKAKQLDFGQLQLTAVIKGGKIVAFKSVKELDNFNIREVD